MNCMSVCAGNWQEVLRKHIDPEQLPVVYGGTLTDPDGDPRCRTMVRTCANTHCCSVSKMEPELMFGGVLQIKYGGAVPRSYYVQDSVKVQYDSSVTISRGSVFQLEYDVAAARTLLRYDGFSLRDPNCSD